MNKNLRLLLAIVLIMFVAAQVAVAAPFEPNLEPSGFVNDYASVLGTEQKDSIEALCVSLEASTGAEIAVAVVQTTAPLDVKTFAVELFEKWGVGKKGLDNGVLMVVSIEDRRVEVEVGYGLEHILTDSIVGRILDDELIPEFKNEDYGAGIESAVGAMAGRITRAGDPSLPGGIDQPFDAAPRRTGAFGWLFVLLVLVVVMIGRALLSGRECPRCGTKIRCRDNVISAATPFSSGVGVRVCECPKCGYKDEQQYRIPPIIVRSGGSSSGGGRSGGGFGGFGGGRSGGGGAGRSW